jgi:hypothetical protein
MATRRLDEISIFDGKLTFLIPHEWIEGDDGADQDSYLSAKVSSRRTTDSSLRSE